jgi:hypothetical protein
MNMNVIDAFSLQHHRQINTEPGVKQSPEPTVIRFRSADCPEEQIKDEVESGDAHPTRK